MSGLSLIIRKVKRGQAQTAEPHHIISTIYDTVWCLYCTIHRDIQTYIHTIGIITAEGEKPESSLSVHGVNGDNVVIVSES